MSGTIDQNELMMLSTKKVSIKTSNKLIEVLSTHSNVMKGIKHLVSLTMKKMVLSYGIFISPTRHNKQE